MAVRTQLVDVSDLAINKEYSRISKIHKYWSRKPWYIVERYIELYSKKSETILDPFMGSGSTGLETILKHRNFIGYDLNPFSVFLTECTLSSDYDQIIFDKELEALSDLSKRRIMDLYRVGDGSYIHYAILGPKNTKDYNVVLSDYQHKNKSKDFIENLDPKILNVDINTPDRPFPKKFYKDRFSYKGVEKVSDMFTPRNLAALSILYDSINTLDLKYKDLFKLALSNTLLHVSKLKSENIRPLSVNNYWIPDDFIEENVWWRFQDRVNNIRLAKSSVEVRINEQAGGKVGSYSIYNKSALSLDNIDNQSIDYIFTDPPYGDAIQYSELSYIWNTWLNMEFDIEEEVIINPVQHKDKVTFNSQLSVFLKEAARVLKDDRYMTLCFQNKDITIWVDLAKEIKKAGFNLVDVSAYDTLGSPYNKSWSKYSPKSDFYITFKKSSSAKDDELKGPVSTEDLIKDSLRKINSDNFNIGRAYDEFVMNLIKASFTNSDILNTEKLNIKSVVHMIRKAIEDGNLQQRLF